jgi:hypothetical protein
MRVSRWPAGGLCVLRRRALVGIDGDRQTYPANAALVSAAGRLHLVDDK